MHVYLIRHAQSTANVDPQHLIGGKNQHVKLTREGRHQAKLLGRYMRRKGISCDKAYSSDTVRTRHTAELVLDEIDYEGKLVILKDLGERDQGDWQGQPHSIYERPEVAHALAKNSWNFIPGDRVLGESENEVAYRMVRALKHVVADTAQTVFIFSHAHAIRCLLAAWCDLNVNDIYIDNTSVTLLRFDGTTWLDQSDDGIETDDGERVCSRDLWNDTAHLRSNF